MNWCSEIFKIHGNKLRKESLQYSDSLRTLIRAITIHKKDIVHTTNENYFSLQFLCNQL